MRFHLLAGALTVLMISAGACGDSGTPAPAAPDDDGGGSPTNDGGSGADTGSASDGGTGADTGSPSDTGAPPEAGPDGSTLAGCAGLRYCDDFESYSGNVTNGMTLGPWKASVADATMTVDTVKPHAGAKSLHVTTPAGAAAHGTLNQTVAAGLVPGNDLFGRAMVYYSNATGYGLPLAVHSWIFNSTGTSTVEGGTVSMNLGGGGAKLQLNYHPVPPATEQSVQGGTMTAGVWHCVQWQYDGSGTAPADDAKVWVDGVLAVEATPAKKWDFATPWSMFDFGFTHYQTLAAGDAVDIYLDDFAMNETMVACPP
jgi:hypothetical protein